MTFHAEVITEDQQRAMREFAPIMSDRGFYLGGGTAVAIHLGHRRSVDLDWFRAQPLENPAQLAGEIQSAGISFVLGGSERGSLHGTLHGVRTSFFEYRYPLLEPAVRWTDFGCEVASRADLAGMKLLAIAQRGLRKDFVDVYALGMQALALRQMLDWYCRKFGTEDTSRVLYSLSYFEDAEAEPMPQMLHDASWEEIKSTIQQWVREAAEAD